MPKFGEGDVNDPASAEGFTVIFNKARDEKKTGGKPESPSKADPNTKYAVDPMKPQAVSFLASPLNLANIPHSQWCLTNPFSMVDEYKRNLNSKYFYYILM